MNSSRLAAVAAAALALSASPSAQLPPQEHVDIPRFHGGIELVQLDVSVLNDERRPVTGLTVSDFTVLENGRERPIRAFTPIRLAARAPLPQAADATISPDIATNQIANQDGRLVFILMDRTIPPGQPTITARRIAAAAVDALGPGDLAAVITTSGVVPQTLTANRARLRAALDQDFSTGITREQEEIMGKLDPLSDGRCLCGLCVLDTVTRIADAARNVPRRRKMLLFIGEGLIVHAPPRDPRLDVGCDRRVDDARRRMVDSLGLSHLTVHSIDPAGLVNLGPHTRAGAGGSKPLPDPQALRRQMFLTERNDHLQNQNNLRVLPELTGGRTVFNTNAPDEHVPAIFDETASYYVLAFEPATPPRDDEKRKIEVRVRPDGLRVQAQRHYTPQTHDTAGASARSSRTAAPLDGALQGLLPNAGRPLTMALAAFAAATGSKALVTINVDVGAFVMPGGGPVPLDFAVSALDRFGRQTMSARQTSTITFDGPAATAVIEANVQTQLELGPGDYEIRLGVSDLARERTASVYAEIAIPTFGSAPLSLSDVTFETTGRGTSGSSTAGPTTRRVFDRDEQARAILQVYQGTERHDPLHPVAVRVSIVDASGGSVRDQVMRLMERQFTDRRTAVAADINGLPAGEYVLRFEASMAAKTSGRAVRFAVR